MKQLRGRCSEVSRQVITGVFQFLVRGIHLGFQTVRDFA